MSGKTFHLIINTPTGILFEDDIIQAEVCSSSGYYALLADHSPVIGSLKTSICYLRDQKNNRVKTIVNNGIFQFDKNVLNIFTDFFCFYNDDKNDILKIRQEKIDQVLNSKINDNKIFSMTLDKLKENLNQLKKIAKV